MTFARRYRESLSTQTVLEAASLFDILADAGMLVLHSSYIVTRQGQGILFSGPSGIGKGTVSASPVHVRQVVENALYAGASTIILAHNHPSGVALPSDADVLVTRRIQEALAPLGIRLADHIIVADDDYVSMAESGFLQR